MSAGKNGFPLLAPVGIDIKNPRQLFLVYMPILLEWHRVLLILYAAKPVIGTLNPPMSKPLIVDMAMPGKTEVDGMMIVADEKGSITRISAGQESGSVELDFHPTFPNLGVNIMGGSYCASREGDRVAVELDVTQNWKPSGLPFCMELFTRVVHMFRTWPATYRWRSIVELGAEPVMSGAWERK